MSSHVAYCITKGLPRVASEVILRLSMTTLVLQVAVLVYVQVTVMWLAHLQVAILVYPQVATLVLQG